MSTSASDQPSADATAAGASPAERATTDAATPVAAGQQISQVKKVRVHHLLGAKQRGEKLTMLTAYDAVTARILDAAGTDMLLVGDSLGNVMLGYDSTMPVTLDEMVVATRSVASATTRALVVADLPFGTYEAGPEQALASAVRLMRVGANAVKLEGGRPREATVRALSEAGIPVVGHLGFTPQSVNKLGGFRVQGRDQDAQEALLADARALADAGAVAVVLEMVPAPVAARITQALAVPTIGIGAGVHCDGQVLVWTDMAGMTEWKPRFVRRFGQVGQALQQAAQEYNAAVRYASFPGPAETFEA
ncbi:MULTISPECIES: 3-methyl-2-oxobutanoate hydroxymethyltransferase [unclassified Actinomyces]|uniref:3-methyl-2-oxobutanoate hydroxymethyltransferase n=1 Tax=unclassified Actinomyces TaxID=2609248 RepID=UPI0013A6F07E|nr:MULTISPECIES: 3-methyl-2-oxobutanoate hydroxymethyltransferase [unclassified Actinomyces]MBW3069163.1 3-methyl-2-oxobutanoate hydroxymethyltransferase [Actinomyces sp. 594]NDR54598.1 3-methyl-2-oxobutanoate hydroxymethyltransferase [Actinomyces sp. 565]